MVMEPHRTSWVVQNNKIHIQYGGRPPYCRILELAYQLTDLDETWVVASHHVPDMPAMLQLPWQQPLPSSRCLATAHCTLSSYGRLEAERVNQF